MKTLEEIKDTLPMIDPDLFDTLLHPVILNKK